MFNLNLITIVKEYYLIWSYRHLKLQNLSVGNDLMGHEVIVLISLMHFST